MAVELGKFIGNQLSKLSSNHPDRNFLEGMLCTANAYINKESSTQKELVLTPTEEISRDARTGPYLIPQKLKQIMDDKGRRRSIRILSEEYLKELLEFGTQSLAHLCLPSSIFFALRRGGNYQRLSMYRIEQVREAIKNGTLLPIRTMGIKKISIIQSALEEFDRRVEESKNQSNN